MNRMNRFFFAREKIKEEIANGDNPFSREIGQWREHVVIEVLEDLKKSKVIRDYIAPGSLSHADVERGIDTFIVWVGEKKYHVVPLSITGETWVEKHKEKHPEIPIIAIKFGEDSLVIKKMIMAVITSYQ